MSPSTGRLLLAAGALAVTPGTVWAEDSIVRFGLRQSRFLPQVMEDVAPFYQDAGDDPIHLAVVADPTLIRTFEASVQLNRAWSIGATYMGTEDFEELRRLAGQLGYKNTTLRVEYGEIPYRVVDNMCGRALNFGGSNPYGPITASSLRNASSYSQLAVLWDIDDWDVPFGARHGVTVTKYVAPAVYDVQHLGVVVDMESVLYHVGYHFKLDLVSKMVVDPESEVLFACGGDRLKTCFGPSPGVTVAWSRQQPSRRMPRTDGETTVTRIDEQTGREVKVDYAYDNRYPKRFFFPFGAQLELDLSIAHTLGSDFQLFVHYGVMSRSRLEILFAPHELRAWREDEVYALRTADPKVWSYDRVGPSYRVEYGPFFEAGAAF